MLDTTTRNAIVAIALTVAAVTPLTGQAPQPAPSLREASLVGRDSFNQYCASCHGSRGQGDGPVAAALKSRTPNLTTLALRANGAYPADRVRDLITGNARMPTAHGTSDMPTWGRIFRGLEGDARARVRVDNLVAYIATLQAPSTGRDNPGRQLFRTYCASCHGTDGRGTGPLADQMRRLPPDLTRFAAGNGGVFPSERVRRIVDGRDVSSHGDRDMPVWGDAFKRSRGGLTEEEVTARINAIVGYLEGIQERATH